MNNDQAPVTGSGTIGTGAMTGINTSQPTDTAFGQQPQSGGMGISSQQTPQVQVTQTTETSGAQQSPFSMGQQQPAWSAPFQPANESSPSGTPSVNSNRNPINAPVVNTSAMTSPTTQTTPTPTMGMTPPPPPPPSQTTTPGSSNDFKPEGKSKLPLIIAAILLLLAIAGGYFLYMLYRTPMSQPQVQEPPAVVEEPTLTPVPTLTEEEQTNQDVQSFESISQSDTLDAIEQDINNTNLSALDTLSATPSSQQ